MLNYGETPIPKEIKWKEQEMKEDPRDIIVPIRMNFEEMKISQYSQFFLLYDK